jgi:Cu2+-exporting ATPase
MQLSPKTESPLESQPITEKIILNVGGMKCAGCVKAVETQLAQHPGVNKVSVNLATETAAVEIETTSVSPEILAQKLTKQGFPTQVHQSHKQTAAELSDYQNDLEELSLKKHQETRDTNRQLIVAGLLLVLSGIGHLGHITHLTFPVLENVWCHFALATLAILFPGRQILVAGWLGWRQGVPNMNTLIGLGTVTAYIASVVALLFPQMAWECFFDEPVMMLGFILVGRALEQKARNRAASAFKKLLALQPQTARLITHPHPEELAELVVGSSTVDISAQLVQVGEWLQVLPGDKIPVDGQIRWGQTTVDESLLTGEAVPVIKQPGDTVIGGTLNQSGAIAIVATQTGQDTTLSQIVALVEEAQTRKAPVQKLADTVAGYFTYGVLTAALLTFIFWYFIGTHIWSEIFTSQTMTHLGHGMYHANDSAFISTQHKEILISLKLAIAVMVISCPCALGLATPTAILVGTGIGAEKGLLIKGGDVLETVHKLNTVVFDKTGTLTTGYPQVTDCLVAESDTGENPVSNPAHLLELAAAVEIGTFHPLARAIQQAASNQALIIPNATDFHTEPGLGVSAVVDHSKVILGNWEWLEQHKIPMNDLIRQQGEKLATEGKTVIFVAVDGTIAGLIAAIDPLRPDAKATIEQLRHMGLRVILLSGDKLAAANAVAKQLGIDSADVMASVQPDQKARAIQSLQINQSESAKKSVVAMVGDGINDAPALSQADVGIALHSGTDVARSTAEIILMRDCLSDVVSSILLSRATFNKIRQNLFWAFAYNTICIPLAAGALLPKFGFVLAPSTAAALMAFSSISVVTNSVILRKSMS